MQALNLDTLRAVVRACPDAQHRVLLFQDREVPAEAADAAVRFTPCARADGASRWRFVAALARALATRRPDCIVVGHPGLAYLARVAKRLRGMPYVVWVHGIEVGRMHSPRQLAGLRHADRLVAVSRHTSRALAAVEPTAPARTVVLPPVVRDHFRPGSGAAVRRRLGLDGQPLLLTVARYMASEGYKGYDQVVRALPAVLAEHPDTRYALVGQGDDLPRVRALARELGVEHALICAGVVPDDELPAWYNACDLFVMPSRAEGFGIVFIEALACGRPVIAADRGGAPDALLDGRLGQLVDPDDPQRLAAAILAVLNGQAAAELTDSARLSRECVSHFGMAAFEARIIGSCWPTCLADDTQRGATACSRTSCSESGFQAFFHETQAGFYGGKPRLSRACSRPAPCARRWLARPMRSDSRPIASRRSRESSIRASAVVSAATSPQGYA